MRIVLAVIDYLSTSVYTIFTSAFHQKRDSGECRIRGVTLSVR